MKYTYTCKKVTLNDSIKDYAEKKISKLDRYFREEDTSASVTFSVEKDHLCTVEITIRGAGPLLRAQTEAPDGDMRGAIDAAVGYIERQILKNKTRLSKRLRSEGRTIVMVTHDMDVASSADRIITIRDGRVVDDSGGAPAGARTGRDESRPYAPNARDTQGVAVVRAEDPTDCDALAGDAAAAEEGGAA